MPRRRSAKIPVPTQEELQKALDIQQEVVAFSTDNTERNLFFKMRLRNNSEAIIWLDAWLGWKLLKHLEAVLIEPGSEGDTGPRLKAARLGVRESYGIARLPKGQTPQ